MPAADSTRLSCMTCLWPCPELLPREAVAGAMLAESVWLKQRTPQGIGPERSFASPKLLDARITTWPLTWALPLASADLRVYMPLPAKTSLMVADHGQGRTMVLVATKDATIAACSQVSE